MAAAKKTVCGPSRLEELKRYDSNNADQEISEGATLYSLFAPAQGDADNTRDGSQTWMKSIQLEMFVCCRTSSTVPTMIHISLVYDLGNNGTEPAYEDVWDDPGVQTQGDMTLVANEMRNLDYRSRFVVLKDWRLTFAPIGSSTYPNVQTPTSPAYRHISFYKKLPCLKTVWRGNTGATTNIMSGALFLFTRSSHETTEANCPILNYNARVRYIG